MVGQYQQLAIETDEEEEEEDAAGTTAATRAVGVISADLSHRK